MPETIEARLHTVTPLFMGQAAGQGTDPVRPTAVKGALRFWWRALNWRRCREAEVDDAAALRQLHREEGLLFGSAADGQNRQSLFMLRVHSITKGSEKKIKKGNEGLTYIGYGLGERHALEGGHEFRIQLRFHSKASLEQVEQVNQAVKALGLMGGLGARARRGFGSLALVDLNGESGLFSGLSGYQSAVHELVKGYSCAGLPPFSAFSERVRMAWSGEENKSQVAHQRLQEKYREFRSNYKADKNCAFGTPLGNNIKTRRSSPLFMHVHPVGEQFVGLFLHVPAQFNPKDKQLNREDIHRPVEEFMEQQGGEPA